MIRAVIDTNIFISGIFWKGYPYQILNDWRKGLFVNYSCLSIINECADTLRHFRIKLPDEDIYSWCSLIAEHSIIINEDLLKNYPVCDAKDNKFISCAVGGKVDYIISQDKDLLSLKGIQDIKLLPQNLSAKLCQTSSNFGFLFGSQTTRQRYCR